MGQFCKFMSSYVRQVRLLSALEIQYTLEFADMLGIIAKIGVNMWDISRNLQTPLNSPFNLKHFKQ